MIRTRNSVAVNRATNCFTDILVCSATSCRSAASACANDTGIRTVRISCNGMNRSSCRTSRSCSHNTAAVSRSGSKCTARDVNPGTAARTPGISTEEIIRNAEAICSVCSAVSAPCHCSSIAASPRQLNSGSPVATGPAFISSESATPKTPSSRIGISRAVNAASKMYAVPPQSKQHRH